MQTFEEHVTQFSFLTADGQSWPILISSQVIAGSCQFHTMLYKNKVQVGLI